MASALSRVSEFGYAEMLLLVFNNLRLEKCQMCIVVFDVHSASKMNVQTLAVARMSSLRLGELSAATARSVKQLPAYAQ
jgi:hypothetical protein